MAAANPAQRFLGELTCSLCLDYFQDPVSLDCGHNFCQACITVWWDGLKTNFCCPECRETFSHRNFKPNRQLKNIVEASRTLRLESTNEPEVRRVCKKHSEVLKVFCQEDQTPICMVCHLSRDHKAHAVVPIEEAAQEYKVMKYKKICLLDSLHGWKTTWISKHFNISFLKSSYLFSKEKTVKKNYSETKQINASFLTRFELCYKLVLAKFLYLQVATSETR
uniref:Uncharacterized protein n=1 Tax=Chrysemys picta bellii TaxID=8478 RepID=A0A8C3HXC4_CHRPI